MPLQVILLPNEISNYFIEIQFLFLFSFKDDGTVRYSPYYEYLIEIYSIDHWSFVCPGSWDSIDSLVACRQLGYTSVLFWYYFRLSHLDSIYPTQFIEVGCDGLEQNLGQCNHTNGTCVVVETYYGYSYSYYDEKVLLYCSRGKCIYCDLALIS